MVDGVEVEVPGVSAFRFDQIAEIQTAPFGTEYQIFELSADSAV